MCITTDGRSKKTLTDSHIVHLLNTSLTIYAHTHYLCSHAQSHVHIRGCLMRQILFTNSHTHSLSLSLSHTYTYPLISIRVSGGGSSEIAACTQSPFLTPYEPTVLASCTEHTSMDHIVFSFHVTCTHLFGRL